MTKSIKAKFPRSVVILLIIFALLCCLIACGGSKDGDTGGSGDTGSSNTTPVILSGLTLTTSNNVVTFGTPITASATLRDTDGTLVSGAVVSFTATSSSVTFTPTLATALTDAKGLATISINAADSGAGATAITASAALASGTVTSSPVGISVNQTLLTLQNMILGSSSISSYGTTSVSVDVLIDSLPATVPIAVTFNSPCVASGKATLSSPVTTIAGTATSTYKDNGCGNGTDTITASVSGASLNQSLAVSIPTTSNIQFTSASPPIIGTQTASASTLPKSSLVKFRVVDSQNNGRPGIVVDFSLVPSSAPGGITFTPASTTSDSDGYVTTSLTSGTVPTPVWVVATVQGTSIMSQSNTLTITTGLPTQSSFSFSCQTFNIEGWNYDGIKSTLTVIASDRLGTPVPDGTAINFISEGAQINPASCTTAGGACSITFISANDRPIDGRVTVLAYALGEKSFIDRGGNNSYDSGETFYDIGDPYIDSNENRSWDADEYYISSTTSGSSACRTQPGATALPVSYWNVPSKENTCTATWGQNYVRRSIVMVLSGSDATISGPATIALGHCIDGVSFANPAVEFDIEVYDLHHNPMPAGTTISLSSSNGTIKSKNPLAVQNGAPPVGDIPTYTFTMTSDATQARAAATSDPDYVCTNASTSGFLEVTVRTPGGHETYKSNVSTVTD
jgi:hypothetical protein